MAVKSCHLLTSSVGTPNAYPPFSRCEISIIAIFSGIGVGVEVGVGSEVGLLSGVEVANGDELSMEVAPIAAVGVGDIVFLIPKADVAILSWFKATVSLAGNDSPNLRFMFSVSAGVSDVWETGADSGAKDAFMVGVALAGIIAPAGAEEVCSSITGCKVAALSSGKTATG